MLDKARGKVLNTFPGICDERTNVQSAYLGRYSAIYEIMELLNVEIEEGPFVPEGSRTPAEEAALNRRVARVRARLEGNRPWAFEEAKQDPDMPSR
jgi:hypothetical protein